MSFRLKLQYLLVKQLQISNKEAKAMIQNGEININSKPIFENEVVNETQNIGYKSQVLQQGKQYLYYAFYKPRGIESTLDKQNTLSLLPYLPNTEGLFPVGRLDKESEGLMLLTNNGKIFDKTLRKEHGISKVYEVKVNKKISDEFLNQMSMGIEILGQKTLPCTIQKIDDLNFEITVVQGLNRQIRRMCYKLNYEVLLLKRTKIGDLELGNLQVGQYKLCSWP